MHLCFSVFYKSFILLLNSICENKIVFVWGYFYEDFYRVWCSLKRIITRKCCICVKTIVGRYVILLILEKMYQCQWLLLVIWRLFHILSNCTIWSVSGWQKLLHVFFKMLFDISLFQVPFIQSFTTLLVWLCSSVEFQADQNLIPIGTDYGCSFWCCWSTCRS